MKEICLYQPIYSYTAESFINAMEAAKGNDVTMRINCNGGDVMATMGMIAKFNEHKKGKSIKVDGAARSMAAYFCTFSDSVECLDSSEFLFHRAAFPDWIENDKEAFTDELKGMLLRHNAVLRGGMESKMNIPKFEALKGKTLDQIFDLNSRIDVTLTAAEAKECGLVQKVVPLNAAKKTEINALYSHIGMAAVYNESIVTPQNKIIMTKAEIKAQFPEAYAEIIAEERDRVESWMLHVASDTKAVADGIASGKPITSKQMHELMIKGFSNKTLDGIKAENPEPVTPPAAPVTEPATKTEAEAKAESILAEVRKNMGIKK